MKPDRSWTPPHDHRSEFEAFVTENLKFLCSVARRYVGLRGLPACTADDVLQDALRVLWGNWPLELSDVPGDRLRAFVCRTMSNLANGEDRARRRHGQLTDPVELPGLAGTHPSHEDRVLARTAVCVLVRALVTLSDDERQLFDLMLAELPRAQIADELGLTTTNINTKICRIRQKLRRSIDRDPGFGHDQGRTGGET